ncbi:MAG: plasmid pRiA4b ORF-3 family protein [Verrucomicrobiaceae bacterium]
MNDPIDFAGGEISPEALEKLNALLDSGPGEGASEEEVAAFMERVMATEGGMAMIKGMAEQLTEGGGLDRMLKEEAETLYTPMVSPARMIFRVELSGTKPLVWRRLSLPADASFFDLHIAIQDAFGWEGRQPHRFEVWEDGRRELCFGPEGSGEGADDYCEVQNGMGELFQEGVTDFLYLYDLEEGWKHGVVIEALVPAGEKGTSGEVKPKLHDGAGHGPPEGCGGVAGWHRFLAGEHPLCQRYEKDVLEVFREGNPDLDKVVFRDAGGSLI